MVQHIKINVIQNINIIKNKNRRLISIDADRAFEKIQHPFIFKITPQNIIKRNDLNILRAINKKFQQLIYSIIEEKNLFL